MYSKVNAKSKYKKTTSDYYPVKVNNRQSARRVKCHHFTCSKLTIETVEQGVKYVQS